MEKIDKFINYSLTREIEDSNLYLKLYNIELKYYIECLNELDKKKPLFFTKKKIKKYELEKKNLLNNIERCKNKVKKEYNLIMKLAKSMNNN